MVQRLGVGRNHTKIAELSVNEDIGNSMVSESDFENVPVKEFGDLIFSIGTAINLGVTKMGELSQSDGKVLRELGHAIRMENFNDVSENGFPELAKMKFDPAKHSKVFIYKIIKEMLHNLVSFERAFQYQSEFAIRGKSS